MRSADEWARDAEARPVWVLAKAAVIGTIIVLVCVAIVGLATTGSVFFQGKAAKATNPARVERKVYDPNNTIAQIAFFHDQCQSVNRQLRVVENNRARQQSDEQSAKFAKDPVRQQQAEDALQQDATDVTGAENALQATVADYNSRSAQSTANVFKGHNLPERIVLPDSVPHGYKVDCG